MGLNLTGQLISATYEDLVQISGSVLTDGLGNNIDNLTVTASLATNAITATSASFATNASTATSASFAQTASFALNVTPIDTGSFMVTGSATLNVLTFEKADGSTFNLTVDTGSAVTVDTGSLMITGSVSSNTLTFTKGDGSTFNLTVDTGSAITVDTGSLMLTGSVSTNVLTFTKGDGSTFNLTVDTGSAVTIDTGSFVTTASISNADITFTKADASTFGITVNNVQNASTASIATSASFAQTASLAQNIVNGLSPTFDNITVTNTASFGFVQSITGSAVYIGDSFVVVNADSPALRYAGIAVFDSGSSPIASASLEWDSLNDTWITQEETGNTSVIITGPTGSRGSETYTTVNKLQKGLGFNYIGDSSITDDGINVVFTNPIAGTSISASSGFLGDLIGTASFATSASFAANALSASFVQVNNNDALLIYDVILGAEGFQPLYRSQTGNIQAIPNIGRVVATSFSASAGFTGSLSGTASFATTASLALFANNGFPFTGSAEITGSLIVTGSATVAGGPLNVISDGVTLNANVVVGDTNTTNDTHFSALMVVGRNINNQSQANSFASGENQTINNPSYNSAILGGNGNTISGNKSAIIGGTSNTVNHINSVVVGGTSLQTTADDQVVVPTLLISGSGGGVTFSDGTTQTTAAGGTTFPFTGSAIISGSLEVTGSINIDVSSSISGSNLVGNWADTYSTSPKVHQIVTLTQAEYNALTPNENTLYIISGSTFTAANTAGNNTFTANNVFSGSVRGDVGALSITSNTASMDCSEGNFFTIQLVSGSTTHIDPSNILPGQTINLLVNTTGSGLLTFAPSIIQVTGSVYTATTGSGTIGKDIVTFISFDSTNLYLSNIKNFKA